MTLLSWLSVDMGERIYDADRRRSLIVCGKINQFLVVKDGWRTRVIGPSEMNKFARHAEIVAAGGSKT